MIRLFLDFVKHFDACMLYCVQKITIKKISHLFRFNNCTHPVSNLEKYCYDINYLVNKNKMYDNKYLFISD